MAASGRGRGAVVGSKAAEAWKLSCLRFCFRPNGGEGSVGGRGTSPGPAQALPGAGGETLRLWEGWPGCGPRRFTESQKPREGWLGHFWVMERGWCPGPAEESSIRPKTWEQQAPPASRGLDDGHSGSVSDVLTHRDQSPCSALRRPELCPPNCTRPKPWESECDLLWK